MKTGKRVLTWLLAVCLMLQLLPVTAFAGSETRYWETAKKNVPLRTEAGEDNKIVSRIASKNVVVKRVDTKKVWFVNTWHKVEVDGAYTTDGSGGTFWIYEGNLTEHDHEWVAGDCTGEGCPRVKTIDTFMKFTDPYPLKVIRDKAAVRELPYNDGEKVDNKAKDSIVMASEMVQNYKGFTWYKLVSGNYIFSDNAPLKIQ